MNTKNSQFLRILSFGLMLLSLSGMAQSPNPEVTDQEKTKPFEFATYVGENRTVNLMLAVQHANVVTLHIKNENNVTLQELRMRKAPKAYHVKLNFEGSQSGVYTLELSDGRKTMIHRVSVVDIPAIAAQRLITFSPLFPQ